MFAAQNTCLLPPMESPLSLNILIGWVLIFSGTTHILNCLWLKVSARKFSSFHILVLSISCGKTGKLMIAHLFLIVPYDLQQSLRLMDLPIIFMLSVSIFNLVKTK